MNNKFTNTELLIQYLDDELDNEQRGALLKTIQSDAALAEELESLRLAKETVKSYGLKKRIASLHSEMMQERNTVNTPAKPGMLAKIVPYTMRVAAAVIVIIGVSFLYQYFTASPEQLFDENFRAFALHQSRGNAPAALQGAYSAGNMAAVVQQYNEERNPDPENIFLAGNAYLNLHQPAKAITAFLALQQQNRIGNTHHFEEDTDYYLAMAYLLNHQAALAMPIFKKINADKNHTYHNKVSDWFVKKAARFKNAK